MSFNPLLPRALLTACRIGLSESGWTNNELTVDWFEKVFLPNALAKRKTDDPIVLYIDGHESHETDAIRKLAFAHGIIVIAFPAKCTHRLQPLDVVIYSQTARRWTDHCTTRIIEGVSIDRYNVIHKYCKIRDFMTPLLIKSAFRATGIYPVNRGVFKEIDFAPSKTYSAQAAVPASFPAEIQSSPVMAASSVLETDEEMEDDDEAIEDDELLDWSDDGEAEDDFELDEEENSSPGALTPNTTWITRSSSITGNLRHSRSSSTTISVNSAWMRQLGVENLPPEEMKMELHKLILENKLLSQELAQTKAQLQASDAHCTIMSRAASEAQAEAQIHRKKTRRSVKTQARFVTKPDLEEAFEKEMAEKVAAEKEAAEKEAEKAAQEVIRLSRIQEDTASRQFTRSLSSYKKKDDLIILAGALSLSTTGTVAHLYTRIKSHLEAHPELTSNSRFTGLFKSRSRLTNPSIEAADEPQEG